MSVQSDQAGFTALYRAYYSLMLTTCGRRLDSFQDAEDAVAEVFRIAWQRYDPEVAGLPWLYAITRNVIGNRYRSARRFRAAMPRLAGPEAVEPPTGERLEVLAALDRVRPADREILLLAYWDDLSTAEIAEVLGIAVSAVWARLSRARAAVRRALPGALARREAPRG